MIQASPGIAASDSVAAPLSVRQLSKYFEYVDNTPDKSINNVIADVSFDLNHGEIVSIVGPSGCGKSTLLNLLCGLTAPSTGTVKWYGSESVGMPKRVGYMLQKDLLFPWRTTIQNVMLGLEMHRVAPDERYQRASVLLERLGLKEFHNHYPSTLSGGMRQRVALARTLVNDPEVLLLDEPFAALDFQTKLLLEGDMATLVRSERRSLLLITHDVDEAVSLSDRVIVLSHRPAKIRAIHSIDLDSDRTDMMAARDSRRFNEYVRAIWGELELQGV